MKHKISHFCDTSIIEMIKSVDGKALIISQDNEQSERIKHTLSEVLGIQACIVPDIEILPYDEEHPQANLVSDRFRAINGLISTDNNHCIYIASSRCCFEKIMATTHYKPLMNVSVGDVLDKSKLELYITTAGYKERGSVALLGDYLINPKTIDIFPFGANHPIRIYIENNRVESITAFSPETQINKESLDSCTIYPTKEYPTSEQSSRIFRARYKQVFGHASEFEKAVAKGSSPRGIDYYKYLFNEPLTNIISETPSTTAIFSVVDLFDELADLRNAFKVRHDEVSSTRDILDIDNILMNHAELQDITKSRTITNLQTFKEEHGIVGSGVEKHEKMHATLKLILQAHKKTDKTLISINTETRIHQLNTMLKMRGMQYTQVESWEAFMSAGKGLYVIQSDLDIGYIYEANYSFITEHEIFGSKTSNESELYQNEESNQIDLISLSVGMPIVHAKYGVGRFIGFDTFTSNGISKEYIILGYAEEGRVWVPIDESSMLSQYKGFDPEHVPLDNASSKNWTENLLKAVRDVNTVSRELLNIKAKRLSKKREPYIIPTYEYRKFSNEFPFRITRDQGAAIQDILNDLQSDIAMDRLVIGDVGYGKTEVAMRAALIACENGKQCCVLVPTTLLAEQHFETFKERFGEMNFNIALLTRESKGKEKEVLEGLKRGDIDIVIGTHRLIQNDISFSDLGMLIVDEEHRFGVKQKEAINKKRGVVDMLSLTATPIPRTLAMTMHGIRDISSIKTAPMKRLAVRTISADYSEQIINEALQREIGRNGQVFVLQNDISKIEDTVKTIQNLNPKYRVRFAHSKMKEVELQNIMQDFRSHKFDILVSTTIIEIGIDVPNANTILMLECDKLGLAQMHQLRGRVGRSTKQAYAYLLNPINRRVSEQARKRIDAMLNNNNLGGGFLLANADLEIRGAGEILGENQSGHIHDIGFQMYLSLLEDAMATIESGEEPSEAQGKRNQLSFHIPANLTIPESYIKDKGIKATYMHALSCAKTSSELKKVIKQMEDRFGDMPLAVSALCKHLRGKILAKQIGIGQINILNSSLALEIKNAENKAKVIQAFDNLNITFAENGDQIVTPEANLLQESLVNFGYLGEVLEMALHN